MRRAFTLRRQLPARTLPPLALGFAPPESRPGGSIGWLRNWATLQKQWCNTAADVNCGDGGPTFGNGTCRHAMVRAPRAQLRRTAADAAGCSDRGDGSASTATGCGRCRLRRQRRRTRSAPGVVNRARPCLLFHMPPPNDGPCLMLATGRLEDRRGMRVLALRRHFVTHAL